MKVEGVPERHWPARALIEKYLPSIAWMELKDIYEMLALAKPGITVSNVTTTMKLLINEGRVLRKRGDRARASVYRRAW